MIQGAISHLHCICFPELHLSLCVHWAHIVSVNVLLAIIIILWNTTIVYCMCRNQPKQLINTIENYTTPTSYHHSISMTVAKVHVNGKHQNESFFFWSHPIKSYYPYFSGVAEEN